MVRRRRAAGVAPSIWSLAPGLTAPYKTSALRTLPAVTARGEGEVVRGGRPPPPTDRGTPSFIPNSALSLPTVGGLTPSRSPFSALAVPHLPRFVQAAGEQQAFDFERGGPEFAERVEVGEIGL